MLINGIDKGGFNYATQKGFPVNIVIIDLIWGTVLTSIISLSGYYIVKLVG
ncbi:MAG: DUF2177 family protein [Lentimicrobium sp.]|nr:DUF2177 family protein [Lentimicrobium sp.]